MSGPLQRVKLNNLQISEYANRKLKTHKKQYLEKEKQG